MRNVEMKVEDNKLHIVVDLSKEQGLTESKKAVMVGSTDGFTKIEGMEGYSMTMVCVRKKKDGE